MKKSLKKQIKKINKKKEMKKIQKIMDWEKKLAIIMMYNSKLHNITAN